MHGNVCEWTALTYGPYPYDRNDSREEPGDGVRVVRGGPWDDLPRRCRSAFRLSYEPFMCVYSVGFRVAVQSQGFALTARTCRSSGERRARMGQDHHANGHQCAAAVCGSVHFPLTSSGDVTDVRLQSNRRAGQGVRDGGSDPKRMGKG